MNVTQAERAPQTVGIGRIVGWFGFAAGVLSLALLMKQGLEMRDFVTPLQTMLDWYKAAVEFSLGWAEPYLHLVANWVRDFVPWHVTVHPDWKHLLVATSAIYAGLIRFAGGTREPVAPIAFAGATASIAYVFVPAGSSTTAALVAVILSVLIIWGGLRTIDRLRSVGFFLATLGVSLIHIALFYAIGLPGLLAGVFALPIVMFVGTSLDSGRAPSKLDWTNLLRWLSVPLAALVFVATNAGLALVPGL